MKNFLLALARPTSFSFSAWREEGILRSVFRHIAALRMIFGFAGLLLCSLHAEAEVSQSVDDVRLFSKTFEPNIHEAEIEIHGHWVADQNYDSLTIPSINASLIRCSKIEMICMESLATIVRAQDDRLDDTLVRRPPPLFALLWRYSVIHWDDKEIVAERHPKVTDVTLTINLLEKTVKRQDKASAVRDVNDTSVNQSFHLE
jgi:hypothetical protein